MLAQSRGARPVKLMGSIHSREEPWRLPALRRTSFSLAPASDICGLEVAVVSRREKTYQRRAP
jgi:hypothetical protein